MFEPVVVALPVAVGVRQAFPHVAGVQVQQTVVWAHLQSAVVAVLSLAVGV